LADRIGVMYLGKIVEQGPTREIILHPRHPYTQALISVVPVPDPGAKHERIILKGERPDPSDIPPGCRFHPRCPVAFERCGWTSQEVLETLQELSAGDRSVDLKGLVPNGSLALAWNNPPADAESWLKEVMALHADAHRALKAITAVESSGHGVNLRLHTSQEPTLKEVATDTLVACLLYS